MRAAVLCLHAPIRNPDGARRHTRPHEPQVGEYYGEETLGNDQGPYAEHAYAQLDSGVSLSVAVVFF